MSSSECPKCGGPRDPKALYCPFCGAVFSKLESSGSPPPPPAPPPPPSEPELTGGGFVDHGSAGEVNPYQAPSASVARASFYGQPQATELAQRLSRLAAQLLDGLIVFAAILIPLFATGMSSALFTNSPDELSDAAAVGYCGLTLLFLLPVAIANIYFLARDGQTLGKKMLRIRIVRVSGEKAGFWRIVLLRSLVPGVIGNIPILGLLFTLTNYLFIFGEERRCIHDYIADTKVVVA